MESNRGKEIKTLKGNIESKKSNGNLASEENKESIKGKGGNIKEPNCNSSNTPEEYDDDCCVDEVGAMMQKLVRAVQLFERDQIKAHGFTTTQCYTILELYKTASLTMNELSDRMNLNSSTMTRILDNLVRDSYIARSKNESDRRIVIVSLTEKGIEVARDLDSAVKAYYKQIINNIPSGQVNNILESVSVLQKAFEKSNPYCC
ncbi:MAG TPA: MarR family transcriptional regulator [Lachnospiraceae bacterium]|nr:MarR family transcriptional regulator [Lachnospiraceae bacterium]